MSMRVGFKWFERRQNISEPAQIQQETFAESLSNFLKIDFLKKKVIKKNPLFFFYNVTALKTCLELIFKENSQ